VSVNSCGGVAKSICSNVYLALVKPHDHRMALSLAHFDIGDCFVAADDASYRYKGARWILRICRVYVEIPFETLFLIRECFMLHI